MSRKIQQEGDLSSLPKKLCSKALVIFNPIAGSQRTVLVDKVVQELRLKGWQTSMIKTQKVGHAETIVLDLQRQKERIPDILIVAGGDGTVNEVINGLSCINRLDLPVALIPTGTVNLLANEIRLPDNPKLLAEIISTSHVAKVVLGKISTETGSRIFLMTASVGFDARAVCRLSKKLKTIVGRLAYIAAGIEEYFSGKRPSYQVTIDGETISAQSVLFANGKYYAGRKIWAREASIKDQSLKVGVFANAGRLQIPLYAVALFLGILARMPGIKIRTAKEVELRSHSADPIQADGDIVAWLPARISVASGRANLICPKP